MSPAVAVFIGQHGRHVLSVLNPEEQRCQRESCRGGAPTAAWWTSRLEVPVLGGRVDGKQRPLLITAARLSYRGRSAEEEVGERKR